MPSKDFNKLIANFPLAQLPSVTFACGPAQGHPQARLTPLWQTQLERNHRAPDISTHGLYKETTENLRTLLGVPSDYTLIFFPGGATPAMDAVAWSLTKKSLSGLSFGAFSHRWCGQIAGALESDVKKDFQKTAPNDFFPHTKPDYNASLIFLTPNETSTGVQIPNNYLTQAWQKKGTDSLIAWDCTSCAGGRTLPTKEYDVMVFSLQKCFGAAGGTSVLILSPAAVKRIEEVKKIRRVPYSLDLSYAVAHAQKFQTVNTPNTPNIWLANEAAKYMLEHGGLTEMDALCRAHCDYMVDWAHRAGWLEPLISDEQYRSYTTLTLKITDPQIKAEDINAALAATGLANLQDGLKRHSFAPENSLRVACFPFVDPDGVSEYEKLTKFLDFAAENIRAKN